MKRVLVSVFFLCGLLALYLKFRHEKPVLCRECNVILLSIDTLRYDRLGVYGYTKNTSPNIDRFSEEAVVFETAISQAPSTAPSHASIFTSLIPSSHKAFFSKKTPISGDVPTAAEILKQYGLSTVSYNGGGQISKAFGFSRGFDVYESYSESDYTNEHLIDRVNSAKAWMENNPARQFFLFLHSYEVHHPYSPKPEYLDETAKNYRGTLPANVRGPLLRSINRGKLKINATDSAYIEALYDAEIRSADDAFGKFIDYLKEKEIYERSIIIITSDHGEEFGEHGSIGWHSHTLFDELLRVPLIVRFPEGRHGGKRIKEQVRSIDILPTILEVMGKNRPKHFEGISLMGLINGKGEPERQAVSQKDSKRIVPSSSLRTLEWKLIRAKLYDLKNDPRETLDVSGRYEDKARELKNDLEAHLKPGDNDTDDKLELDEDTNEQLRTLGYIN